MLLADQALCFRWQRWLLVVLSAAKVAEVGFAFSASVVATQRATIATKSKSSASATTAYDLLLW